MRQSDRSRGPQNEKIRRLKPYHFGVCVCVWVWRRMLDTERRHDTHTPAKQKDNQTLLGFNPLEKARLPYKIEALAHFDHNSAIYYASPQNHRKRPTVGMEDRRSVSIFVVFNRNGNSSSDHKVIKLLKCLHLFKPSCKRKRRPYGVSVFTTPSIQSFCKTK